MAIAAGGSGLYMRAALAELPLPPQPAPGVRERMGDVYEKHGPAAAHALLAERDAVAAAAVHPNDRRRVVRALELAEAGASLAPETPTGCGTASLAARPTVFGLELDPAVVTGRIGQRTRQMFERGVEDEVRRALSSTASRTPPPASTACRTSRPCWRARSTGRRPSAGWTRAPAATPSASARGCASCRIWSRWTPSGAPEAIAAELAERL